MLPQPHQDGQHISVIPQDRPLSYVSAHKHSTDNWRKCSNKLTQKNLEQPCNVKHIFRKLNVLSKWPHQLIISVFVADQFYSNMHAHVLWHTGTNLLIVFLPSLRASSYSSLSDWLSSTCSTNTLFLGRDTRGRPFTSLFLVRRSVMHFTRVWRFLKYSVNSLILWCLIICSILRKTPGTQHSLSAHLVGF